MNYNKPPLSIAQQIQLLKQRGLIFKDEDRAKRYLSFISLYRLRAYAYTYQNKEDKDHTFYKEVFFDTILNTYLFDRKLRLLVFDDIERIEIAFRTQIIYHYSLSYGSNWYEDQSLYRNNYYFTRDLALIDKELIRSNEVFIKHYKTTYSSPQRPPAWMSLEITSLGLLSKVYENLRISPEKKTIANNFNLGHPKVLESWMHSLAVIRNICAHHGRIWNRELPAKMKLPKNTSATWLTNTDFPQGKLFLTLSSLLYLLNTIIPGNHFIDKFKKLIKDYPVISLEQMGFPDNWENEKLWTNK